MEAEKEEFWKSVIRTSAEFILIALIIYLMRNLFNVVIFTFIFSYLMYNLQKYIVDKSHLPRTVVIVVLYVVIVGLIGFIIYRYIPEIIKEVQVIYGEVSKINIPDQWSEYIEILTKQIDISKSYETFMNTLVVTGKSLLQGSFNLFISLILSMIFILDIERVKKFLRKFKTSKVSKIYNRLEYFGTNFLNSFGKVIQAQILIALVNSILSTIALWIMGFPQLIGLGFMIFVLSFIPVAGVIISLIPLSLIAFNIGGIIKLVSVIIMIVLLHSLESYILNPKLMSDRTSLPVPFIFIILILGEELMGTWGLLLGIPLVIFALDILDVRISDESKKS
ncbi:AI-2E family transporter [Clostridium sp. YIM B02505]|uniref:AI-2E family transporter n=1 Tax=Clostridium yunnanense TaxID=2800325 RepID=A0ABS1ELY7_9CLOT|nr:AI-2E family transporter [Clostridium yunnanense]MBK1810377.1 AI-2E family transporter [Clostridium yunnanense]